MTVLALFGLEDMYALNALKVVAACASNLCAIVTFIAVGRGAVALTVVLSMVFAGAGGYMRGRTWRGAPIPALLRTVVVCTGLTIAGVFFLETAWAL